MFLEQHVFISGSCLEEGVLTIVRRYPYYRKKVFLLYIGVFNKKYRLECYIRSMTLYISWLSLYISVFLLYHVQARVYMKRTSCSIIYQFCRNLTSIFHQ